MDFKQQGYEDMDWIYLRRNRSQWRALFDRVMNLREHKIRGIS